MYSEFPLNTLCTVLCLVCLFELNISNASSRLLLANGNNPNTTLAVVSDNSVSISMEEFIIYITIAVGIILCCVCIWCFVLLCIYCHYRDKRRLYDTKSMLQFTNTMQQQGPYGHGMAIHNQRLQSKSSFGGSPRSIRKNKNRKSNDDDDDDGEYGVDFSDDHIHQIYDSMNVVVPQKSVSRSANRHNNHNNKRDNQEIEMVEHQNHHKQRKKSKHKKKKHGKKSKKSKRSQSPNEAHRQQSHSRSHKKKRNNHNHNNNNNNNNADVYQLQMADSINSNRAKSKSLSPENVADKAMTPEGSLPDVNGGALGNHNNKKDKKKDNKHRRFDSEDLYLAPKKEITPITAGGNNGAATLENDDAATPRNDHLENDHAHDDDDDDDDVLDNLNGQTPMGPAKERKQKIKEDQDNDDDDDDGNSESTITLDSVDGAVETGLRDHNGGSNQASSTTSSQKAKIPLISPTNTTKSNTTVSNISYDESHERIASQSMLNEQEGVFDKILGNHVKNNGKPNLYDDSVELQMSESDNNKRNSRKVKFNGGKRVINVILSDNEDDVNSNLLGNDRERAISYTMDGVVNQNRRTTVNTNQASEGDLHQIANKAVNSEKNLSVYDSKRNSGVHIVQQKPRPASHSQVKRMKQQKEIDFITQEQQKHLPMLRDDDVISVIDDEFKNDKLPPRANGDDDDQETKGKDAHVLIDINEEKADNATVILVEEKDSNKQISEIRSSVVDTLSTASPIVDIEDVESLKTSNHSDDNNVVIGMTGGNDNHSKPFVKAQSYDVQNGNNPNNNIGHAKFHTKPSLSYAFPQQFKKQVLLPQQYGGGSQSLQRIESSMLPNYKNNDSSPFAKFSKSKVKPPPMFHRGEIKNNNNNSNK